MLTKALQATLDAVHQQDYAHLYHAQIFPVLGLLHSVPAALVSGTMAVVKIAQSIFEKIKNGTPFFRSEDFRPVKQLPLEDAFDLGIIFTNNLVNICTLGVLNSIFVYCNSSLQIQDYGYD